MSLDYPTVNAFNTNMLKANALNNPLANMLRLICFDPDIN